ncbi:MAG: Uma2 family endonuclease [Paracoccaceae bacterium]|nr:Uma2 family endonuclease [Paracoccaceae bacterium]
MTTTIDEHHVVGPLGSDFWKLEVPPELVPALARELDWNRLGRRVMIDAREGIISWMSPSGTHEGLIESSDMTVKVAGAILDREVKAVRGIRWKRPGDPPNVGLEADASFYIGTNAERWLAVYREGGENAVQDFEAGTPPDLVIEVEIANSDDDKPDRYASLGVREMWRVHGKIGSDRYRVEILNLQEGNGPRPVESSIVLDGLEPGILPAAFRLARGNNYRGLQELLKEKLVPAGNPESEPNKSPPTPSM